jgi:hypothetical protein
MHIYGIWRKAQIFCPRSTLGTKLNGPGKGPKGVIVVLPGGIIKIPRINIFILIPLVVHTVLYFIPRVLEILRLRMEGRTEQETADAAGFKTASAAHKRIAKLAGANEDFVRRSTRAASN